MYAGDNGGARAGAAGRVMHVWAAKKTRASGVI